MNIIKLLNLIEEKPRAFLLNNSIYELEAFLQGYIYCLDINFHREKEIDILQFFLNDWLINKMECSRSDAYLNIISETSSSEEGLKIFFEYWNQYLKEKGINKDEYL